jgi:hypothetical protein
LATPTSGGGGDGGDQSDNRRQTKEANERPVDLCIYSELMLLKLSGSCEHGVSLCLRTVATSGSIVYSLGDM